MIKFKLRRWYHKLFPKKALEKVNSKIAKDSCQYWKRDWDVKYSPFHSAQDVFEYLRKEECKKTYTPYSGCGGLGCGGGCFGGCGGGCN